MQIWVSELEAERVRKQETNEGIPKNDAKTAKSKDLQKESKESRGWVHGERKKTPSGDGSGRGLIWIGTQPRLMVARLIPRIACKGNSHAVGTNASRDERLWVLEVEVIAGHPIDQWGVEDGAGSAVTETRW